MIPLGNGSFKVSESGINELERICRESEQVENAAKSFFVSSLKGSTLLPEEETWKLFNDQLLIPLVRDMGARTYELVSGTATGIEKAIPFKTFLEKFQPEARMVLQNAVLAFIDPQNSATRSYILRYLNNYFFLEASNLPEETISALSALETDKPSFTIFVDTNFLFSILGLHDNPSNSAALSLQELLNR